MPTGTEHEQEHHDEHEPQQIHVSSSDKLELPAVAVGPKRLAVDIKGLCLWYGDGPNKLEIFRDIDVNVQRAGIYALLGCSGCGKTTLLRCVLGRKPFQRGEIHVFGTVPGTPGSKIPGSNVGYMPQELALFDEFSTEETLAFFGQIYNLPPKDWRERAEFLISFLELPDKTRPVKFLSGGQKRRVSLAAALVHNPPLLILDEPTVGIDPVLRMSIWNYLVTLTQERKMTVIITTHYIDEARLATTVGFLRSGRMLAEDSPAALMKEHGKTNLEDVFLVLAKKSPDESPAQSHVGSPIIHALRRAIGSELGEESTQYSFLTSIISDSVRHPMAINKKNLRRSLDRTEAIFHKNVLKIMRNPGLLLYSFLLPAVEVMLFCSVVGRVPFDMTLSVVNEDTPPRLSVEFLKLVDPRILPQVNYTGLQSALDSVSGGLAYGVVHMKPNFSRALEDRLQKGYIIDSAVADASSIDLHLDMSNEEVYMTMMQYLQDATQRMIVQMFVQSHRNTYGLHSVLKLEEPIYGSLNTTFTEFVAPGMMATITYMMAVGLSSNSLLEERSDGLLERCTVAGVQSFEVVFAHVTSQIFVIVVQDLLLLFVAFFVFQLPCEGPLWVVIVLTLSQGVCGMSLGLMISSLIQSPSAAGMLTVGLNYPTMILSGILWPLEGIPYEIRWLSYLLPQTIPADALRSTMYKGWTIAHSSVWMGFLVTYVWVAIFLFATIIFFRQ